MWFLYYPANPIFGLAGRIVPPIRSFMAISYRTHRRLIIVSYRLPFAVRQTADGIELRQNSGGLVSAVLSMAERMGPETHSFAEKIHWIGYGDESLQETPASGLENDQFVVHPVSIDPAVNEAYYGGFCNNLIWPLFHYFPSYTSFRETYYDNYKLANEAFLRTLSGLVGPDDLVWIHDYQLMLLPGELRSVFPAMSIGYFFHIPFPSYEVFKLIPRAWRQELLEGILGADLVGFHTVDYVTHFLQSVEEVLALPRIDQQVVFPQRSVQVREFPISVDFEKFNETGQTPAVVALRKKYKSLLRRNKIIFSVDRLDYSKGITERLLGYERFLMQYPDWHDKVTFVMTVVPSRDKIAHYQDIKREIEETVGRINGLFGTIGWRPIVYSYLSLTFDELLALYTVCDVALITPIRDGMNLVSKEFVASRYNERGVLILSEMAGAAQELPGALIINPTDTQEVAAAIRQALEMPLREQTNRLRPMRQYLQSHDVFRWAHRFLRTLEEAIRPEPALVSNLPVGEFAATYREARKRLLLFDYDGTLTPLVDNPEEACLPDDILALLRQGSLDNDLVIISGRNRAFLERIFDRMAVYLIAEHGAFIRDPNLTWQQLTADANDWAGAVQEIMNQYVARHEGSFLEIKETAVTWHYRTVPGEEVERAADELAAELRNLTFPIPLSVMEGAKVVEVKPAQHSKGTIARHLAKQQSYDFIMSLGDDATDEDMFRQLPNWAYTIKVGAGKSNARYRLARQSEVAGLLALLFAETAPSSAA